MNPAEDNQSYVADSWSVPVVESVAVPEDGRTPSEHRTGSPEVVEEAEHPTAHHSYLPYRCYGLASSTCCRLQPAGTMGTVIAAAAAASDEVLCVVRTAHQRFPVVPCLGERLDRIDSRHPFFQATKRVELLGDYRRSVLNLNTTCSFGRLIRLFSCFQNV